MWFPLPKRILEKHFMPPRQAFSNRCCPAMFSPFHEILQAEVLVFESNRHRFVQSQNRYLPELRKLQMFQVYPQTVKVSEI